MAIDINKIKKQYEEENQNGDFETLPIGEYNCFVYELEGKISSNDNPMISITLKVTDGEYENRRLWTNATLTPKAWFKVEEFFDAVNYDMDNLPELAETPQEIVSAVQDDVLGTKVNAVVDHRTWNGKEQENVKKLKQFTPIGDDDNEDKPF